MAVQIICIVIISYLLGNVNAAVIVSKLAGKDVRDSGSGNPGTMNMIRSFGKKLGVLTLIIDVIKAMLACAIACFIMGETPFITDNNLPNLIAGLSVTIGHILPAFMKFKGGKGIACIIGVNLATCPIVMLITFAVCLIIIVVSKVGTFGTLLMIYIPMIYEAYILGGSDIVQSILIFAIVVVAVVAHNGNVIRLFKGEERPTHIFKKKSKN